MKKRNVLFLAVSMGIMMTACGKGSEPKTTNEGGNAEVKEHVITIQSNSDSGNLNPYALNTNATPIVANIYESLWIQTDGETEWKLATGIEETDDLNVYYIHLREGVTFSNGDPFHADDVIFSLKTAITSPTSASGSYFERVVDMDKTVAEDDYTVKLVFREFDCAWKGYFKQLYIVNAETYNEEESVSKPMGTGPYILTSYQVGTGAEMIKNENWWQGVPEIDKVIVKSIDEDPQITTALESGQLDVSYLAPTADLSYLDSLEQFSVFEQAIPKSNLVYFNMNEGSAFENVDARAAVCYAIDNQAIIDTVYQGLGVPSTNYFSVAAADYQKEYEDYSDVYGKTGADLEKARELLEKSGMAGKDIVLAVQSTATYKAEAEVVQAALKEIGFGDVQILAIDNSSFMVSLNDMSLWDIAIMSFTNSSEMGLYTADSLFNEVWPSITWPGKEAFFEKMHDATRSVDETERAAKMQEVVREFEENIYWYNIFDLSYGYVYNVDIENFRVYSSSRLIPIGEFSLK